MNNENNNNQNNNYVTPEKVDLTNVNVENNNNGTLNRERDNIVSATIQANASIDETSAKTVNNTIKVKKKNPALSLLVGVLFIAVACILAYFGYRLLEGYIKYDDAKHTTTTTTTKKVNYFANYTYDLTKLRKFQNATSILILMPELKNGILRYIYTEKDGNNIITEEEGTYNITDKTIYLTSDSFTEKTLTIEESSLRNNEIKFSMYDQEYKYYVNKTDGIEGLLIVNATLNETFAYLYDNNIHEFSNYTETSTDITLNNGHVFVKSGTDLLINNITYSYVE